MPPGPHRFLAVVIVLSCLAAQSAARAQRSVVDIERSTPVTVVTARDLENLPSCGRAFSDVLRTVPLTPALNVERGSLQIDPDVSARDGLTYSLGQGAPQPLDVPFCVNDIDALRQPITFFHRDMPVGSIQLHFEPRAPVRLAALPAGDASSYFMSPILLPAEVQTVRGPFSGPSSVDVNGVPGTVLSQTARTLYWMTPPNTPGDNVTVTVKNGGKSVRFSPRILNLEMSADELHLLRGQSTTLHATVSGPDQIPASGWTAGEVSEVIDKVKLAELFPNFKIPRPGDPAVVLFRLDNASRDTMSLSPSKNESVIEELKRDSFAKGPYRYSGRIQSKKAGDFSVNGVVVAFFAPVAGVPEPPR